MRLILIICTSIFLLSSCVELFVADLAINSAIALGNKMNEDKKTDVDEKNKSTKVACKNILYAEISYREETCQKGEKIICNGDSCHLSDEKKSYKIATVPKSTKQTSSSIKVAKVSTSQSQSPKSCIGDNRSFVDKLACGPKGSKLWHSRVTEEDKNKFWDKKSVYELCATWDRQLVGVNEDAIFGNFFRQEVSYSLVRRGMDPLKCSNPAMDKSRVAEKKAEDAMKKAKKAQRAAEAAQRMANDAIEKCLAACGTNTFCDCY